MTFLAGPVLGQYREYYISGKVVDTQKTPLEGVEITLRDAISSRSYSMKTKKDGEFKFVGLPRGDYKVVFKKDGYAVKEDEWKLLTPQAKMEKVEIPPVIMATEELVQQVETPQGGRGRGQGGAPRSSARATTTGRSSTSRRSSTRTPRTPTPSTSRHGLPAQGR